MPTAEARIETERPSRYLVQLCKHFSNKGRHLGRRLHGHSGGDGQALRDMRAVAEQAQVEWSDTEGQVTLPWGRITLRAAPGVLMLRAEAAEDDDLRRLQDLAAGHVERFGRRDGLLVNWQPTDMPAAPPEAAAGPAQVLAGNVVPRRSHLKVTALVAVVVLVLAVHLGLGGVLLSNWRWTGWAAGGILAVVLLKVALLGGFAIRRGRASRSR
ncbi:DUF2218 domain-containing protein [Streptomyces sp. F001]|uniref:DUF2218 domain-containing protein n=1 Tax=Streptomyces sp. F001 TaxID=1510026 RepID=UPI00101E6C92|nr:DUF2218 domain-containing protein [Streptomyces sp. F001]RZB14304.1 DUF2218 domain-containing protein [Streptomyces sp. F001]